LIAKLSDQGISTLGKSDAEVAQGKAAATGAMKSLYLNLETDRNMI